MILDLVLFKTQNCDGLPWEFKYNKSYEHKRCYDMIFIMIKLSIRLYWQNYLLYFILLKIDYTYYIRTFIELRYVPGQNVMNIDYVYL